VGALASEELGNFPLTFANPSLIIPSYPLSGLEIVTKLCSPDFARRAKSTDFHTRAWDVLRPSLHSGVEKNGKDKILTMILAFFAALVGNDSTSLIELVQAQRPEADEPVSEDNFTESFVETLVGLLGSGIAEREKDLLGMMAAGAGDAELKKAGMGRTEKPLVSCALPYIFDANIYY
jgi:hypothetical protein